MKIIGMLLLLVAPTLYSMNAHDQLVNFYTVDSVPLEGVGHYWSVLQKVSPDHLESRFPWKIAVSYGLNNNNEQARRVKRYGATIIALAYRLRLDSHTVQPLTVEELLRAEKIIDADVEKLAFICTGSPHARRTRSTSSKTCADYQKELEATGRAIQNTLQQLDFFGLNPSIVF